MGAIIESIRSLVESKNIKSLEGMRSDIKNALEIMCTSSAMDAMNPPVRFELPEDMSFWPDIMAMRKTASGQPVLTIETDSYGKIAKNGDGTFKITKNGEPKVNPDGSYEYITNMVEGKMQYESFIAYEDRAWDKIGFDAQPDQIGDNVTYIVSNYIENWKQNGFSSTTATASGQFDADFKDNLLFFPDLVKLKDEFPKVDTSAITNWKSAFANSGVISFPKKIDTSGATDVSGMFQDCSSLEESPEIDVSEASSIASIFSGCSRLKRVGKIAFDPDKWYNLSSAFSGTALTELSFPSIFVGMIHVNSLYDLAGSSATLDMSNAILSDGCSLWHLLYYKYGISRVILYNLPKNTVINNEVAAGNAVTHLEIRGENTDEFTAVLPVRLLEFIKMRTANCQIYVHQSVYKDLEADNDFYEQVLAEGSTYKLKNINVHVL